MNFLLINKQLFFLVMNKVYPLDILSIKDYGINNWFNHYSQWPLPETEYMSLLEDINKLYIQTAMSASFELKTVMITSYKIMFEYLQIFHSIIVLSRLLENGMKPVCDKTNSYFYDLLNIKTIISGIYHDVLQPYLDFDVRKRILYLIKAQYRNYKYFNKIKTNSHLPPFLAMAYPGNHLINYATSHDRNIKCISPIPLLSQNYNQKNAIETKIIVNTIVSGLESIAVKFNVYLDSYHISYLQNTTNVLFQKVWHNIYLMKKVLKKYDSTSILVKGLGNLLIRCFCSAGSLENHKIVSITHGNNIAMFKLNNWAINDLAMVDEYVIPNKKSLGQFIRYRDYHPISCERKTIIKPYESNYVSNIWNKYNKMSLPTKIKNVMFLEWPMKEQRSMNTMGFWHYQLILTLRIGLLLRKQKVQSIIKRHPDRLLESQGLYNDYYDVIIDDPFESICEMADLYIIPNIQSTVFGFAMLTNRPIICFESMLQNVWDNMRELLEKRCIIIPSWFDSQTGEFLFDDNSFQKALQRKPEKPNTEFVEKYML